MQKRALIVAASVLLAASAMADELSGAVDKQLEVQEKVKEINGAQKVPCPTPTPATLKDCIEALCPSAADGVSYETMIQRVEDLAEQRMGSDQSVIQKDLDAWGRAAKEDMKASIGDFERQISSETVKIDPAFQRFHDVAFISMQMALGNIAFSEQSTMDQTLIDEKATAEKLKDLPEAERKWLIAAEQGYYNLPEVHDIQLLAVGGSGAGFLATKYPGLSLKDALKKEAAAADAAATALEKLAASLGLPAALLNSFVPKHLMDAARNGTFQDEASLESFLQDVAATRLLSSEIAHSDRYPWLKGRPAGSVERFMKSADMRERAQKLKAYLETQGFEDQLKGAMWTCASNYSQNAASLPTDAELSLAKKQANDVIADLKSRVFSRLSAHTAAMLSGVFNKLQVFFPWKLPAYQADLISSIKEAAAENDAEAGYLKAHPNSQGGLMTAYTLMGQDWSPQNAVSQQLQSCDAYQLGLLDDRASPGQAVFWASWLSVKNPKLGKTVMAHEMGHILDWALLSSRDTSLASARKYQAVEACLASKHPEAPPAGETSAIFAEGTSLPVVEGQYTSEDFADQVAALAEPDTSLGCVLIGAADRENPSVVSALGADEPHSSHPFRALFSEWIRKGKLPEVCKAALSQAGTTPDFNSCF